MRVIKPMQQGLLFRTLVKDKRYYLAVASLSYFPFHNPIALGTEVDMWETISSSCYSDVVFDMCIPKVQSEVIMVGNCFAPEGKPTKRLFVDLDIGPIIKRVVVTGDRVWKRGERHEGLFSRVVGSDWEASDPEPFTEMDIGWKNAFGGDGYADNPIGKGYLPADMSPSMDHTSPLPNVERPEWMVSIPTSIAEPAGYGPIDVALPYRSGKYGKKYGKKWEEERYPEPAVDMDPTYYNAAPADQQLDGVFWEGDERFVVTHMHRDKPKLESGLPQVRPRCFTLQTGGTAERWREIDLLPETVWLFPNVERGILVSRGLIEIDTFYGVDVDVLLLAWELKGGRTRTVEDYRKSVARRVDEETAGDWIIREDDLSPPEGIPEEEPIFVDTDETPLDFTPIVERAKQGVNSFLQEVKDQAASLGIDPSKYLSGIAFPPVPLPAPPKLEKLSDVAKIMEWAKAEDAKFQSELKKIEKESKFYGKTKQEVKDKVEAKAREICKATGKDYDEIMAQQPATALNPEAGFDKLGGVLLATRNEVSQKPDFSLKPEVPNKAKQLSVIDDMMGKTEVLKTELVSMEDHPDIKEMELAISHKCDPPERPSDEVLASRRKWVQKQHELGENCEGADLCFVDLSELSLKGMSLKGAKLDSAVLINTDLSGADLSEAILARADCSNAVLVETNFLSANLGKGCFRAADLSGATLDEVILDETDFSKSNMVGAKIKSDMCWRSIFDDANLSEVIMVDLDSVESSFNNTTFIEANLTKASFTDCKLVAADFSKATLEETTFTEVVAAHSVFKNATMKDTNIHMESDFSNANFSHIKSDSINFSQTNLSDASFEFASLPEADFGESTLVRSTLYRAVAREANFTDADLTQSNFNGADLMKSSFQGAIMTEANFTDAHLFEADLLFANYGEACFTGAVVTRTLLNEK